ncbi:YafQ toxin protein [Candidatus Burkholderia pumila]|uniref:YafQ toxin protein n=1 Tax=Candidatus Burkholderia pumila TaxID=1090375 RepID=A0ABR5HJP0_9BURK|nr:YafQ toxin protein [Candidatus Burkholderia pumila]
MRRCPRSNLDHALIGEWSDHRDCHLKPDLVLILIYRKPDPSTLQLVRLGSHTELGLYRAASVTMLARSVLMPSHAALLDGLRHTSHRQVVRYRHTSVFDALIELDFLV